MGREPKTVERINWKEPQIVESINWKHAQYMVTVYMEVVHNPLQVFAAGGPILCTDLNAR